jgi:pantothenate kinase
MSLDDLARRAEKLAVDGRAILGITGSPGAGKSALAGLLIELLDPEGAWVARVPMDGFHLADAALDRLGRRSRKGAIDTFDAYGYLAMLRRIQTERDHTVYAPDFQRTLEQPIAGAIAIAPATRLVITEGNYILSAEEPWPEVRRELMEVWYVELDELVRRARLVARHVDFGKSEAAARRWVDEVDEANARAIAARRGLADLWIYMSTPEAEVPPPTLRNLAVSATSTAPSSVKATQ